MSRCTYTHSVRRVPAPLVRLLLEQSGRPIQPASLRNWTRRGHITRTDEGYDPREVLAYVERRELVARS